MPEGTEDTHEVRLLGDTDCPNCGETATTWWEIPLEGTDGDEVYRVSCPNCGHKETY